MYSDLFSKTPLSMSSFKEEEWFDVFPDLKKLSQTPQDPIFHAEGDVWTHTKMVIEELLKDNFYQKADATTRFVLFQSALLHDISKPQCTKREEDGRITSKGHSTMGAIDARIALWKKEVPFEVRERICRIIATHQVPFFALGHDRQGRHPLFTLHQLSWEGRLCDLSTVAKADMRGRQSIHQKNALDDLELFDLLAQEENCLMQGKAFASPHTRLQYIREKGNIALDYPFFQEKGSKVVVMSGLPASGKDTYVKQHYPHLEVVSFDDAKASLGIKHGENAGRAVHMVIDRAKELLASHQSFVWNATHISPDMRKKTLDLLYQYHAEVELVYLEQPYSVLMQRNQNRDTTLSNKNLEEMFFKWDVPLPYEAHHVCYNVAPSPTSLLKPKLKK